MITQFDDNYDDNDEGKKKKATDIGGGKFQYPPPIHKGKGSLGVGFWYNKNKRKKKGEQCWNQLYIDLITWFIKNMYWVSCIEIFFFFCYHALNKLTRVLCSKQTPQIISMKRYNYNNIRRSPRAEISFIYQNITYNENSLYIFFQKKIKHSCII